jgi:hypothetical protein
MSPSKSSSSSSSQLKVDAKNQEVPIFLRKTYHMIDTCDDNVCSWCEEGTTFVVKEPETFEKVIIPQFFKHSKFSSFVRQLNFYGFRKIKYTDSIRINTAEEQKTANFWRFRHENFKKGREDLLGDIKRMNSASKEVAKKASASTSASLKTSSSSATTTATVKKVVDKKGAEVKELKEELNTLKDRIKEMTSNIDQLTSLVQTVTLKPCITATATSKDCATGHGHAQEGQDCMDQVDDSAPVGNKRKKTSLLESNMNMNSLDMNMDMDMVVDQVGSSNSIHGHEQPIADTCASSTGIMAMDDIAFHPTTMFPPEPVLSQEGPEQVPSARLGLDEELFVDELFHAFDSESDMDMLVPLSDSDSSSVSTMDIKRLSGSPTFISPSESPVKEEEPFKAPAWNIAAPASKETERTITTTRTSSTNTNAPDQAMMNKLSDALTVLPKDVQEMLVNRLISTITSPETMKSHMDAVCAEKERASLTSLMATEAASKALLEQQHNDVVLQTASATLTALLTQFSVALKDKETQKRLVNTNKTLPVITVHA